MSDRPAPIDFASPTPESTEPANAQVPEPRAEDQAVSLCDALDRVLNKGVVARGDVVISIAGVPMIYLGLGALLSSVDSARDFMGDRLNPPRLSTSITPERAEA